MPVERDPNLMLWCLCLWLLLHIPDRGLPEAYECLERISSFYAEEPVEIAFAESVQRRPVKKGASYERPPFQVEEE
jgi:hypothetical protein